MNIEQFKSIVGDIGTGTQPPVPQQQSDVPIVAKTSALPEQREVTSSESEIGTTIDVTASDPFASVGFPSASTIQTESSTPEDPFASIGFPSSRVEPTQNEEVISETNIVEQLGSGINEGIGNILGLPGDLSAALTNLGASGINALFGTDLNSNQEALFGSDAINETILDPFISEVDPQTGVQRFVRAGGRAIGQSVIPVAGAVGAAARPVRTSAQILASELGSEGAAQVAREVAPDSVAAEIAASILGAFAPTSAIRASGRVGNIIGRIANSGNARDIASVRRVVNRMANNSPSNITEESIINAIASDTSLQKYLTQNIGSLDVGAGVVNAGAAQSPNVLGAIGDRTIRGTFNPVTGEAIPSIVKEQVDAAQDAVTRLGVMTENSLSNLTPSRLAEISKDITDNPEGGGRIFERVLISKIGQFIDNDTDFLRKAGYRAGDVPVIKYDSETGVPYLIKKKNGQIPDNVKDIPTEDRISVFNAPTLKNASGNILSSVRGEIDGMALADFREGRVADQQLAADVFSPTSRGISQTIGESSPEFAETSARQRAARIGQEALEGASRGQGTNAIVDLRRQIESLDPDDPLLRILDSVEPSDANMNLDNIIQQSRETDLLTRVGGSLNPRSTGVDYASEVYGAIGQAAALGGQSNISNINAGRSLMRMFRRKNIPGRPTKKELSDSEVITYMLDLATDREKFSKVFNKLRKESTDKEFENAINSFVASIQGLGGLLRDNNQDNDLESQLGAQ